MTDEAWIDTVRLARDFGTVDQLLPEGIDDLRDMPYPLFDDIRRGLVFLSFEELPRDEQPPKRIWLDQEQLAAWFDEVRRKREREMQGGSGAGPIEDPVDNEAARGLIVG